MKVFLEIVIGTLEYFGVFDVIRLFNIVALKTDRQAGRQAGRQTEKQTDRQTDRQAGRQADRPKNKQTHRQIDERFYIYT